MGHYASEMDGYSSREIGAASGYDHKETINQFYAPEDPGTGKACPRCGASLEWHWMNVDKLLLHIRWHAIVEMKLGKI